jgi:hypothetical protein
MVCRTCRSTSFTRRLETLLQITLSDRIKDAHLIGCCISLSIADIALAPMMAWKIVSLYDQGCLVLEDPDDFVDTDRE